MSMSRLGEYLDEKARLRVSHRDEVFVAEAGTEAAQAEVLELLIEHLPRRFPEIYQRHKTEMEIIPLRRTVPLAPGRARAAAGSGEPRAGRPGAAAAEARTAGGWWRRRSTFRRRGR